MSPERWTRTRVLAEQRAAILAGKPYRGPSLSDVLDPAWHEIERADDAELMRMNGDPSHFEACASCVRRVV